MYCFVNQLWHNDSHKQQHHFTYMTRLYMHLPRLSTKPAGRIVTMVPDVSWSWREIKYQSFMWQERLTPWVILMNGDSYLISTYPVSHIDIFFNKSLSIDEDGCIHILRTNLNNQSIVDVNSIVSRKYLTIVPDIKWPQLNCSITAPLNGRSGLNQILTITGHYLHGNRNNLIPPIKKRHCNICRWPGIHYAIKRSSN